MEALAAQRALARARQPMTLRTSQVQRTVEALRQRLQCVERRRCKEHPSYGVQTSRTSYGKKEKMESILSAWRRSSRSKTGFPAKNPSMAGPAAGRKSTEEVEAGCLEEHGPQAAKDAVMGGDAERPGAPVDLAMLQSLLR